jgi:hypothetical protein
MAAQPRANNPQTSRNLSASLEKIMILSYKELYACYHKLAIIL